MSGENKALRLAAQRQAADRAQIAQGLKTTLRLVILTLEQRGRSRSRAARCCGTESSYQEVALQGFACHFQLDDDLFIANNHRAESRGVASSWHGAGVHSARPQCPWTESPRGSSSNPAKLPAWPHLSSSSLLMSVPP